jgi:hypothetical protein
LLIVILGTRRERSTTSPVAEELRQQPCLVLHPPPSSRRKLGQDPGAGCGGAHWISRASRGRPEEGLTKDDGRGKWRLGLFVFLPPGFGVRELQSHPHNATLSACTRWGVPRGHLWKHPKSRRTKAPAGGERPLAPVSRFCRTEKTHSREEPAIMSTFCKRCEECRQIVDVHVRAHICSMCIAVETIAPGSALQLTRPVPI